MQRFKQTFNVKKQAAENRAFVPRSIMSVRKIETSGVNKFDRVNQFFAALDRTHEDRNYENAGDLLTKKDGDLLYLSAVLLGPDYAPLDDQDADVLGAYNKLLSVSHIAVYAGGDQVFEEHLSNLLPIIQFKSEFGRAQRSVRNENGVISFISGGIPLPIPSDVSIEIEHRIMPGVTMDYTHLASHRFGIIAHWDEFKQGAPAV